MDTTELVHGLWWPTSPDPREARRRAKRIRDARAAATEIAALARTHDVVLQAGGHVGLWPMALAEVFAVTVTFEPDATNYTCLTRNIDLPNIIAFKAALGALPGAGRVVRTAAHQHLSGAGYVIPGDEVPVLTIDEAVAEATDTISAIVLDVEGGEYAALQGAAGTLRLHRPLVVVEAGAVAHVGTRTLGDIERLLARFGYGAPRQFPLGRYNHFFYAPD
jgi:FkbM family methyltransferase